MRSGAGSVQSPSGTAAKTCSCTSGVSAVREPAAPTRYADHPTAPTHINLSTGLVAWCSGNAFDPINEVTVRRARLVLRWVTACGQVNHLGM